MRVFILSLFSFFISICFAAYTAKTDGFVPHRLWDDTTSRVVPLSQKKEVKAKSTATDTIQKDSVQRVVVALQDTLRQDSVITDTIKKKGISLDAPIKYNAADSLVYDAQTGLAYLYGRANVEYQDMTLTGAKIFMNLDSTLVRATGAKDTTGVAYDTPIYKQGSEEYKSEEMAFNFKSKKGLIQGVSTTEGNGFLHSERSKRISDGTLYLEHARYTTCNDDHPHFYLALSRAKVRPGKEVSFGPAYLVVADVPLPLALPYGFFPFNKKYSSGFIMPSYGDETTRGFYLRDGGYYFAINDHYDATVLGEIYTKGSWGLSGQTNYRRRYRYNGNVYLNYLHTVEGEKNMPDYQVTKSFKVQWTHNQDAKANPKASFSARVNFASTSYERSNLASLYNPVALTQSTRTSSVSYSYNFEKIGLSLSTSFNLMQNMRDSSIAVTLPDLSVSVARFYPFRRKNVVGKERWYEKISMSYTGAMSNSISTKENLLFKSNLIKKWRNGMRHSIPIDATFQLFKYINISPHISIRDYMYTNRIEKSWDAQARREVVDTAYGFYNLYDWNMGVSANTTLYGFYKPSPKVFGSKIIAVRHVVKPSIGFTYSPDFTTESYGYHKSYVRTEADGTVTTVPYSPYANGLYGVPSGRKQGLISMSLSNNLEMKVKSDADSTGEKKISLIDELSGTLSYNMAAPEKRWSNLSTRLRLKLTKSYTFSMAAVWATYAYMFNDKGQVVEGNRTEWSFGRFGRFQGMSQNLSYTFNNQTLKKLKNKLSGVRRQEAKTSSEEETKDEPDSNLDPTLKSSQQGEKKKVKATLDEDGYLPFSMPWSLTVSYGISMHEDRSRQINVRTMRYPYSFTQTMNFSGYVRIADGWNISFSSGYDFKNHGLSMTTASLSRDLHCFNMSCSMVLHPFRSFNFSFRAVASELADALKWEKRSSYSNNIDWY